MAESDALAGRAVRCEGGTVRLETPAARALLSVRMNPASDSRWIGEALGVPWRSAPLKLHSGGEVRWWSTAPGVWLIDGPADHEHAIQQQLNLACSAVNAMVTVVSDAWGVLLLSGPESALRDLFERAGPVGTEVLDGACIATRFGPFAAVLFDAGSEGATPDPTLRRIELRVERPLVESFRHWWIRLGALPAA
ncbi:MAG: hypothetical protein ACKODG_07370 [Betaproteobacteria bacterium]